MTKRVLSIILALVMVISAIGISMYSYADSENTYVVISTESSEKSSEKSSENSSETSSDKPSESSNQSSDNTQPSQSSSSDVPTTAATQPSISAAVTTVVYSTKVLIKTKVETKTITKAVIKPLRSFKCKYKNKRKTIQVSFVKKKGYVYLWAITKPNGKFINPKKIYSKKKGRKTIVNIKMKKPNKVYIVQIYEKKSTKSGGIKRIQCIGAARMDPKNRIGEK